MDATKLWQPTNPDFISDPYPTYRALHSLGSVFQASTGDFVILGYEEVKQVLSDRSFSSATRVSWVKKMMPLLAEHDLDFQILERAVDGMVVQMDPPRHGDVRSVLLNNWPAANMVSSMADKIIEELIPTINGNFDLVTTISRKLPLHMICDLIGLDRSKGQAHMDDGFELVRLLDPYLTIRDLQKINRSATELYDFFKPYYQKLDANAPGLAQAIKREALDKGTEDEGINLLIFVFIAGYETTSTLISLCLWLLIEDKTLRNRLQKEKLTSGFVKEVLRLYSPVHITGRITSQEMILGGARIPEGSTLTVALAAANRDPSHFPNPDKLNLSREVTDHLAFGKGMHHCLGSQIATIEATKIIDQLLPLMDRMNITSQPEWVNNFSVRRMKSLKITFEN